MNLALSLLTCDKTELVEQSAKPLLAGAVDLKYHLYVIDGSTSEANEKAVWDLTWPAGHMHANVRGGAGAAIVYALTMMLKHEEEYSHVGLVESDVLLLDGWLACLDLFDHGRATGFDVGAVSARCYVDRVLFQEDRFAVMHNIGAGMIIFTRRAAQLILDTFRTGWSTDNRRIFCQLSGLDIGQWWAFRNNEHPLTADWHWDAVLAANGFASLAMTPSPTDMIGQNAPLAEQGLTIAAGPVEERRNNDAFCTYRERLQAIRRGQLSLAVETKFHFDPVTGTQTVFPHQMAMLGGEYSGDWKLKELRGWGTFGWEALESPEMKTLGIIPSYSTGNFPSLSVPVFGACAVLVSGGKFGGKFEIVDEQSGYKAAPDLPPEGEQGQVLQLMVPASISYRKLRITALTPGVVFYGIQTRDCQPCLPNVSFNHAMLPPA